MTINFNIHRDSTYNDVVSRNMSIQYSDEEKTVSLKTVVEAYDVKWNFDDIVFDSVNFSNNLRYCIKLIKSKKNVEFDSKVYHGYIEKRDVPKGTKIFVRADLHGDLKSLIENLKTLKDQALLDENFKCRDGAQLVFLGDYADRGKYGLQVLELLAFLKAENPDNVHLIKGNHEDLDVNCFEGDQAFKDYMFDNENGKNNSALLQSFYDTMPLTLYIGQKGCGPKDYVQFTHGLFDLDVDIKPVIDSESDVHNMLIAKKRENVLSERIRVIQCAELNIKSSLEELEDALENRFDIDKKQIKMLYAAKQISGLVAKYSKHFDRYTSYNWGDMDSISNWVGKNRGTFLTILNPEGVEYALRLTGVVNAVKMIFRGHQHEHQEYINSDGKVIVVTLPAGENVDCYQELNGGVGHSYLLKTGMKIEEWTKQVITHDTNNYQTTISAVVGIQEQLYKEESKIDE